MIFGLIVGGEGFGWRLHSGVSPERIAQCKRVLLCQGVELGALCTVDRGSWRDTILGQFTKLDSQVHIGHNVQIGKRCVFAAQVGVGGSCTIREDVHLGGQVQATQIH